MAGGTLEVEVKFLVPQLVDLRARLLAAGGVVTRPRVYERNVRYDTDGEALRARYALLRLRQDTRAIITYKGIPHGVDLTGIEARVREELEIVVSDFDTADQILQRLGFRPRQVYEKYRETLQLGAVEVVLDELPFGHFVELEGADGDLRAASAALGLAWSQRILVNYLYLLTQVNAHYGWQINDLTFANFADRAVDWAAIL